LPLTHVLLAIAILLVLSRVSISVLTRDKNVNMTRLRVIPLSYLANQTSIKTLLT